MCIRVAIELGIHKSCGGTLNHDQDEQMERRVFWDCYHLDRMSSSTLGRPFGIADSDISAPLPTDTSHDASLYQSSTASQAITGSKLAVFNHSIRLMQIESVIRASFLRQTNASTQPANKHSDTDFDHLYNTFHTYSKSMYDWWSQRPRPSPKHGIYQAPEYFEFLHRRKKLDLTRAILSQAWESHVRSKELLRGCLRTALSLLSLFSALRSKKVITSTRGFIHLIFSTGLSVISTCVELLRGDNSTAPIEQPADIEALWADLFQETPTCLSPKDIVDGLSLAFESLHSMSGYVPDTFQYTRAFGSLKAKIEVHFESAGKARVTSAINTNGEQIPREQSGTAEHGNVQSLGATGQSVAQGSEQDTSGQERLHNHAMPVPDALSLPADIDDTLSLENYEQAMQTFPNLLDGFPSADPWADMPPMDQLTFDLLDYTWEAPILWHNEEAR